ncbi:MAG: hypothetical protein J1E34_09925 [Oscillospiraceae bacterium]|nr:hypothetical protein [Oscillospiraceae bacterium]
MDKERLLKAREEFERYRKGKAALERRIVENEEWFKQHHWRGMRNNKIKQTGWLYAAIVNKHADFMDNKPEVNVLPREQSDEKTAKTITQIMPVVLDRAGWDRAYDDGCYKKLKFGAAVYGVYWNSKAGRGLGDIEVRNVDALNFFWEPGIEDIQESENIFVASLMNHEAIKAMYPEKREQLERLSAPSETVTKYIKDDSVDDTNKSYVIEWYYKKQEGDTPVLHYCRFVQDIVLFASEDAEEYKNGWYEDGKFPFVIDSFYPDAGTPHGFGIIDANRDTQEDIDELNSIYIQNAKVVAKKRFFSKVNGGINEEEFADIDRDIVHVTGGQIEANIKEITYNSLPGQYISLYENKIAELKENSFNRDVNSGGSSGTTTASGIAALQEAGSKSSRDAIARTYRAFREICEMIIERMRQFYTVTREFRIIGDNKSAEYVQMSNEELAPQALPGDFGLDLGNREPIFDLDVKVSKQNVWSRATQNQDVLNFFGMGFFNPQNSTQALACLEVLDLDNKEKLVETIKQNGIREQFERDFIPQLIEAAAAVNPQIAQSAMQAARAAGLIQGENLPTQSVIRPGADLASSDFNGEIREANSYMDNKRAEANARTTPRV